MKFIVVGGPTASGKTAFTVRIARYVSEVLGFSTCIINADASQLYSELKILTAYPTIQQMSVVPHHLFGILSPYDQPSAGKWLDMVKHKLNAIGVDVVIICGGTGFYISALIDGIADIPKIPKDFHDKVVEQFYKDGREVFFQKLIKLDPQINIHPNDTQRIMRAYEVASFTGVPLSHWWKSKENLISNAQMIAFIPPRAALKDRCRQRLYNMIDSGLLDEIGDFLSRYNNYNGPMAHIIGFSESVDLYCKAIDIDHFVDSTLTHTMQYAKRQSTWFRNKIPNINLIYDFGDNIREISNVIHLD